MKDIKSLNGSNFTFTIGTSKDIQELLEFVQFIAKKLNCSENAVTLISTALSEVCRKFLRYSESLELGISIFIQTGTIEFQGEALAKEVPLNIDWDSEMYNLQTYFDSSAIQANDEPISVSYSFDKIIPHKE